MISSLYWKLGSAIFLGISIFTIENCTLAQTVPDRTLGTESSVVRDDVIIDENFSNRVDGGAIRGENLFHSFQEFNISNGQRVYFSNPSGIKNILTRVTGNSPSEILGKLGILGNANLFLINPNGIIFGPNASLDVKGSFLASTASSLNLADGTQFSTIAAQNSPLLTVSVPIGLQFGNRAAEIRVQSASLEVQPGKTLGLLGGEIVSEGGYLNAPGGRIELGSVASNSLISISPTVKGWSLGYEGVQNFQNIQLTQGTLNEFVSEVNTSGESSGDIQVQGRRVIIADGSQVLSINQGAELGGNLTVNASESLELAGMNSAISISTIATGDAGNITIQTKRLLLKDGAFIATASSEQESFGQTVAGTGRGGNLIVNASEVVELANGFLFSSTQGSGNAGDIIIATGNFTVRNGANVSASSSGTGSAGNLNLAADSISLEDGGKLVARSASGEGGNIRLNQLDLLLLRGGSEISTDAKGGTGNGGNITIDTDTLAIANNSNITANAVEGRGGNIRITTQALFVSPDSNINADSKRGINGVVEIRRPDVDPTAELVILPANVVNVSELVTQGCAADGSNLAHGQGQFTIAGRGGLPPTPAEATRSDTPLVDLGTSIQSQEKLTTTAIHNNSTSIKSTPPLIEANGWAIGDKGEVILTASSPNTPDIPWLTPTSCHSS
ncbi:filamentous hemagglutinin N-terminal domain-containing protein [Chroococcidiopsidales cyanobacterium LEGE 13417]|nr:filamentous hemagglutinin N-terminal domain-containing protein [Chroococcidiopsidales cyanobacterium LEGE 13417]